MSVSSTPLDRLFEPRPAVGWALMRWTFGLAALWCHLPRAWGIGDVYGVYDMVFRTGPFYLADHVILGSGPAWGVWTLGLLGIGGLLWGGRLAKPGLVVWLGCTWLLLANEALNIKAYDRLATWLSLGLLMAPIGERDLHTRRCSPVARWYLLIVYCSLYGSTGWLKALEEPTWWTGGDVLGFHFVHQYFGGLSLGGWLSGQPFLLAPMAWMTVIFEAGFPLLIWWRRSNPLILACGAAFHLGVLFLMNVGPFSGVALAAYPVLLHPEIAERLWVRIGMRSGGV